MYSFSELNKEIDGAILWLKKETASIRAGRATPALVEDLEVMVYGSKMPLKQVAAISVEDVKTLAINPWDKSNLQPVESAIRSSDLGIEPVISEDTVRVILPELTEERRGALKKLLGEKLEQAKISVRQARDEAWKEIQQKEKKGELSEDDKFRLKEEMQELVDEANKKLEEVAKQKEKEINK